MKIKLSNKDIIWSYVGTILSMGANLLMLPFLLYYLDEDMLGLWYVFASVGTITTLFDFGFAVTFARNITYCWSGARELKEEDVVFVGEREPDYALMKNVLATCRVVYVLLAGGALVLLLTGGTAYILYVSRHISGPVPVIGWLIYAVAAFLNLYYGYFAAFLRGVGAVARANQNTVIARAAQILVTVLCLMCGLGLIGACVAYLVYGTLFRLLGKYHFFRYQGIGKQLAQIAEKPSWVQQKELFFVVWHNAWRDGTISLSNYLCNQASTIICSVYLTLSETGIYSMGVQIATAISAVAGTLYSAYQPELQAAYIKKDRSATRSLMSLIVMSYVCLFVLGTLGFFLVGIPALRLVKPNAIIAGPALLGLCLYQFLLGLRNCYTSYFSCTNRILYLKGFVCSAILCVVLSFLAIGPLGLGIWGLIGAQIASQAVYNLWRWPTKAHRELGLPFRALVCDGTGAVIELVKRIIVHKKG